MQTGAGRDQNGEQGGTSEAKSSRVPPADKELRALRSAARAGYLSIITRIAVLLAVVAAGWYLAEKLYFGPLREQQRLISNLKTIVEELTRDLRVAEVYVMKQEGEPLQTTFRFVEVDEKREPIGMPKVFTINGDVAYFDTLVIKFEDSFVPVEKLPLSEDILRSYLARKAIIFFRRVFSEKQKPENGFPLDTPGDPPGPYRPGAALTPFERQLWNEFWDLANDPGLAASRGVRAAHGQAVYTKLQPGKYYVLEKRLSGDLTIRPEDLPAAVKGEPSPQRLPPSMPPH